MHIEKIVRHFSRSQIKDIIYQATHKLVDKAQVIAVEDLTARVKILCFIEGELELKYMVKIFQLFGYTKDCYDLTIITINN